MIIKPVGTLEITQNGEYDVMNKAGVSVQVPLPSGTIQITQNGNTNVNDYEYANVNVVDPLGEFVKNNVTNFEIPEGVTTIPANTFKNYTNLETIIVPDSVTSIGENAFYGCTNLTTVNGGCFVGSIGNNAFYGCPSSIVTSEIGQLRYSRYNNKITIGGSGDLNTTAFKWDSSVTDVIIRKGVTSIGDSVFTACTGLTSVTIPDSVTSIGGSAFPNCTRLTDVYYTGTQEEWNHISIEYSNTPLTNATVHYNYTPSN